MGAAGECAEVQDDASLGEWEGFGSCAGVVVPTLRKGREGWGTLSCGGAKGGAPGYPKHIVQEFVVPILRKEREGLGHPAGQPAGHGWRLDVRWSKNRQASHGVENTVIGSYLTDVIFAHTGHNDRIVREKPSAISFSLCTHYDLFLHRKQY